MAPTGPEAGFEIREAETDDWDQIAVLTGRTAVEGGDLRRRVLRDHDPVVAFVASAPASDARGEAGAPAVPVGAVVAGVRRSSGDGAAGADRVAQILWIGVASGYRRRGLGSRLLETTFDDLRYRQIRSAALLVEGTQVEAMGLFRKAGFAVDGQDLSLWLPPDAAGRLAAGRGTATQARSALLSASPVVRTLTMGDVNLLAGLLIHLGVERAEGPHDELAALTPAQIEDWLQRPGTIARAAWEADDDQTPIGIAWATRRRDDLLLRFVGVHEDERRHGVGRALIVSIVCDASDSTAGPAVGVTSSGSTGDQRPLRAVIIAPEEEQQGFFRALGFEVEGVSVRMSRTVQDAQDATRSLS